VVDLTSALPAVFRKTKNFLPLFFSIYSVRLSWLN
jgi:hypothetical protein